MAAPATLAGVTELADWLGEPIEAGTADHKRAEQCLRIASVLVREESGRTWLSEAGVLQSPVPDAAVMVTLYCAGRVYENRIAQTQGAIDDGSGSFKVEEAGAYLTASERRMLSPLRRSRSGGLGVVATTRQDSRPVSDGWVPTPTPGVEFPWY